MNFSFNAIISKFKSLLGKEEQSRVTGKKKSPATGIAANTSSETGSTQSVRPKAATAASKKRAKARTKKKKSAKGKTGK